MTADRKCVIARARVGPHGTECEERSPGVMLRFLWGPARISRLIQQRRYANHRSVSFARRTTLVTYAQRINPRGRAHTGKAPEKKPPELCLGELGGHADVLCSQDRRSG